MMLGAVNTQIGSTNVIITRDPSTGNTTVSWPSLSKTITVDPNGKEVTPWYCLGLCGSSQVDVDIAYGLSLMGDAALSDPALVASTLAAQNAAADAYCVENQAICTCSKSPVWCSVQAGVQPIINAGQAIGNTLTDITDPLKCGLLSTPQDNGDGTYTCTTSIAMMAALAAGGLLLVMVLIPPGRRRR